MNTLAVSEDRLREIAAPYGGIEAMNRQMDQHEQASARFNRDRELLLDQYPDRWVAVGPDGLLATATTIEAWLAEIRADQRQDQAFVVELIDTSPEVLIL